MANVVLCIIACCLLAQPDYRPAQHQGDEATNAHQNASVPSNKQPDAGCDHAPAPSDSSVKWYTALERPEWAAVAVAAIGIGIIAWQSWETRKAAQAAQAAVRLQEDTSKRQLRAYMVLRRARLILHEDGFVEAKLEIANCGQTPAYDLRGVSLCRFTTYPIRNIPPIPEGMRQSQSIIGAGLAFHVLAPGGRHDDGNREHLLRKLESGNLVYCANSYYTYKDIFQDSHWIKLQLIIGGPGGVRVDADQVEKWASFSNDSEGNEEDYKA